jgi:3-deoxy-manno-octulosonate cytidylyltransferase (CMP-KDO synthetase)
VNAQALAVIPARIGSARLPRKPLYPLAGRPLVQWVWERVSAFELFGGIVVATDNNEVATVAAGFGASVCMTSAEHPSGTDRVAEAARRPEFSAFRFILNVQGDEPFISREAVAAPLALLGQGSELSTSCTPITDPAQLGDPAVVKVVRNHRGDAMLFSRAPVPHVRDAAGAAAALESGGHLRHIGVYGYTREALERWVSLPEGRLEHLERLEQLRPLEAGMQMCVALLAGDGGSFGIDTPADAERAEARLARTPSPTAAFA